MTSQRIIKSEKVNEIAGEIQYNYQDLQQRCEQYLEKVRSQTRQMIIDAEKEAQKIRDQAKNDGVKEGEKLGLTDAQKKINQEVDQKISQKLAAEMKTVLPAFQQSIQQLKDEQQRCIASWEKEVVTLACEIAEKIIHRELTVRPLDSVSLVRDLLQQTVGQTVLSIGMSQQDYAILQSYQQKNQLPLTKEQYALIEARPEISAGGCLVKTTHGEINATVEKQIERIVEELCPGDD